MDGMSQILSVKSSMTWKSTKSKNPSTGEVCYDTTNSQLLIFDGKQWIVLQDIGYNVQEKFIWINKPNKKPVLRILDLPWFSTIKDEMVGYVEDNGGDFYEEINAFFIEDEQAKTAFLLKYS